MQLKKIINELLKENSDIDYMVNIYRTPKEVFCGWNVSMYQWEYDIMTKYALLFYDTVTSHYQLIIYEIHEKTGIGKGVYRREIGDYDVTVKNKIGISRLDIPKIKSILSKSGYARTRAGQPFKKDWTTPMGKTVTLSTIVDLLDKYLSSKHITETKVTSYDEAKSLLYDMGWKDAPYYYGNNSYIFADSKGREHYINLDKSNPNMVSTYRIEVDGVVRVDGVIGDFVGGRGRMRKTPVSWFLKKSNLEKINSTFDKRK